MTALRDCVVCGAGFFPPSCAPYWCWCENCSGNDNPWYDRTNPRWLDFRLPPIPAETAPETDPYIPDGIRRGDLATGFVADSPGAWRDYVGSRTAKEVREQTALGRGDREIVTVWYEVIA